MTSAKRRVALVTGGTRGIGLGIARALAADGFTLALCGIRAPDALTDLIRSLSLEFDVQVEYFRCDVSSDADRAALLDGVRATCGALHVLVNNAGVAPLERKDFLEMTEESFDRLHHINVRGPCFLSQAVARWMIEQRAADSGWRGCIVNVSSVSATMVSVARGEYCMSKATLAMLTQVLAVRLAPEGIPVYEVRPGVTLTDMTAVVREKYDRLIADGLVPQGRWGEPEDCGRAVAALARGDFPYSTGQVMMVDGGMTIPRL